MRKNSKSSDPSIRLVDSDPAERQALSSLLNTEGHGMTVFNSAAEFLAGFEPRRTRCILLSLRLPGMTGLELLEILARKKTAVPIIVLTDRGDNSLGRSGHEARGVRCHRKALEGGVGSGRHRAGFRDRQVWRTIEADRAKIRERLERLSPRELQVLDVMVGGRTNIDIAKYLGISRKTLDIHRSKVLEKDGSPHGRRLGPPPPARQISSLPGLRH